MAEVTYADLKKVLDPEWQYRTKREFVHFARYADDPKMRVGGPKGRGRITVKRALSLLGVTDDSLA